ncbi:MAG: hypothetical protein JXA15_13275 [Spirochaetales bacterium]|nr:hypothetical protein [Spirochaetales bacterium]
MSVPNLNAPRGAARGTSAALFFRATASCLVLVLALPLASCKGRPASGPVEASPDGSPVAAPAAGSVEGAASPRPVMAERPATGAAAPSGPSAVKSAAPPPPFSERLLAERPFGLRLPVDFAIGRLASAADSSAALPAARNFLRNIASARVEGFAVDPAWEQTFRLLHRESIEALPDGLSFRCGVAVEGPDGSLTYPFALIGPPGRAEGSARFYPDGEGWLLAGLEGDFSTAAFSPPLADGSFDPERYDWPD